jgi:carbamoylphosphate synthase small subunit
MQAVQYKKTHPDVYMMFSLSSDPDSTLARSVKTAKSFKGIVKEVEPETESVIEGKKKPRAPKKKTQVIAPDLDFDDKRREEERMKALTAKFHDNETMRLLLNSTGDALLIHKCGPGEPAEPDMQLMRVRKSIQQ